MDDNNKGTASFSFEQQRSAFQRHFSAMIKVVGPVCNLDCDYCYYIEKDALYPGKQMNLRSFGMSKEVLEKFTADFIAAQPGEHVEFIWHGGEPTLLGLDYYKYAVELQKKYANGKKISNVIQTNGTRINDDWAMFLKDENFLCGISIDGPQKFHDKHRRYHNGKGSWGGAMRCIDYFTKHGVDFNTMSVVNASNSREPIIVYEFLKGIGSRFMQFSPIVERIAIDDDVDMSIVDNKYAKETALMNENVTGPEWGNFLCRIFDHWVKRDVGFVYVNWFDNTLAAYAGQNPMLCSMAPDCTCALAVEHNGDAYTCDHFVFEDQKLGNIFTTDIAEMAKSDKQLFFEEAKKATLSSRCRQCSFLRMCGGDCPKNRIAKTSQGEDISALCAGFRMFFEHTRKPFEFMANELKYRRPPANVMRQKF